MTDRNLKRVRWSALPIASPPPEQANFVAWLSAQAAQNELRFALVHADDGVIWGRFSGGAWEWSSGVAPDSPALNVALLHQARLFGPRAELFIWRKNAALTGRLITDALDKDAPGLCLDEDHILWGGKGNSASTNFLHLTEGSQGLSHAPPAEIAADGLLTTRNYIDFDQDGCAHVKASRLVG